MYVDWSERAEYMARRHGVTVEFAAEALSDEEATWLDPDPKSLSRRGIRVIGFSPTAHEVIVVILLRRSSTESYWGVNGWPANTVDRRMYERRE